jgi:hypothetical protein
VLIKKRHPSGGDDCDEKNDNDRLISFKPLSQHSHLLLKSIEMLAQ